jgi:flagellar hook-associated protein 2
MASISSSGIGSGLDVNSLVSQLMAVERQPLTKLDTKEASYQAKISAYGSLKSAVASLQSAALSLKSSSLYNGMSATSSASSVISGSASSAASAGSYAVEVLYKAQQQTIASKTLPSLTADIATAAGKLKIEIGTYKTGDNSFTAKSGTTAVTIDIDPSTSSLSEIRDAINAANAGVKANLVYVGSAGYKLTLTSNTTGVDGSIRMTTLDSGGVPLTDFADGLGQLSFDPTKTLGTGKESEVKVVAQDASFTIDGVGLTRSSNTVADAITGVTLTLGATGTSTLTVSKNSTAIKSGLDRFVTAYNELNTQLRSLTAYNSETSQASLLTGDSGARGLQSALRDMVTYRRSGTSSGNAATLSDLGVSMQRDGSLQIDATKLDSAIASSSNDLGAIFTSTSTSAPGLAIRMSTTLDSILSSTGLIASHTDGLTRSIDDLNNQRERLGIRLTSIEKRYRAQFSALDSLVSSMQQTSSFLTQQLANLPSSSG